MKINSSYLKISSSSQLILFSSSAKASSSFEFAAQLKTIQAAKYT